MIFQRDDHDGIAGDIVRQLRPHRGTGGSHTVYVEVDAGDRIRTLSISAAWNPEIPESWVRAEALRRVKEFLSNE